MQDVRQHDIRVSYVMPGSVATEFSPGGSAGAEWKLAAEDVAHALARRLGGVPSAIRRPSFSDSMRAALMRCTQYVHFSMTPRLRTVTSGLRPSARLGVSQSWYWKKLKRRTLYGQLFEQ